MEAGLVDYLGGCGKSIPSESQAAIKIGLAALSRQHGGAVKYWGYVEGIQQDYHLAQSEFTDGIFAAASTAAGIPVKPQVTYISADGGVRWQKLDSNITDEQYEYCEQLRGPYTGNPEYEYKVERPLPDEPPAPMEEPEFDEDGNPIEREEGEEGAAGEAGLGEEDLGEDEEGAEGAGFDEENDEENEETKPKKKKKKFRILVMKEAVRLAHFVAVRDAQCRLIPRGAYVTADEGASCSPNASFSGLSVETATRLAHYLHAGHPAATLSSDARKMTVTRNKDLFGALHHPSFDFLPSAAEDMPHGTWSVKYNPSLDVVVLHNLLFKGSYFFHKPSTNRFWSVYAGNGQRFLDLPFLLPHA